MYWDLYKEVQLVYHGQGIKSTHPLWYSSAYNLGISIVIVMSVTSHGFTYVHDEGNSLISHGITTNVKPNVKSFTGLGTIYTFTMSLIKIRQEKRISQGISGKCIKVIYNLYDSAKSKIKLNGVISKEYFLCNVGVRQGENLSPLLSVRGKIAV